MAFEHRDKGERSATAGAATWPDQDGRGEAERYRAWIAAKLLQGITLVLLLMAAVVLFDSW